MDPVPHKSGVHTGCRHITDNFPLFGFGNPVTACVQTAKELIENSIDACRGQGESTIVVTLRLDSASRQLMLEVRDSGCGMADTVQGLSMFCTSKAAELNNKPIELGESTGREQQQTGKFGLGLSACLLNSIIKTRHAMRIVTKTRSMPLATITDFSFNCATSLPTIERTCDLPGEANAGGTASALTVITLCLEWIESPNAVNQAIAAIREFLLRLSLLPLHTIRTEFTVSASLDMMGSVLSGTCTFPHCAMSPAQMLAPTVTIQPNQQSPPPVLPSQDSEDPLVAYLRSVRESADGSQEQESAFDDAVAPTAAGAGPIVAAAEGFLDASILRRLAAQVKTQCHRAATGCIVAGANITVVAATANSPGDTEPVDYMRHTVSDSATGAVLKQSSTERRRQRDTGAAVVDTSVTIKVAAVFVRSQGGGEDQAGLAAVDRDSPQALREADQPVRLRLLRYINDAPMVDLAQETGSCGITRAIRSFDFLGFGHRLAPMPERGSAASSDGPPPEGDVARDKDVHEWGPAWQEGETDIDFHEEAGPEAQAVATPTPSALTGRPAEVHCPVEWLLESAYDATATHFSGGGEGAGEADVSPTASTPFSFTLHIIVDYCSTAVPYSNLKKTAIELGAEDIRSIHKALANSLRTISEAARAAPPTTDARSTTGSTADHFRYTKFLSRLEYERGRVLTSYAPTVARALSRMVAALDRAEPGMEAQFSARYGWQQRDSPRSVTSMAGSEHGPVFGVDGIVAQKLKEILRANHQQYRGYSSDSEQTTRRSKSDSDEEST